jgi:uncharacterized protein YfaS (alpha-2-macroglobulin family)
MMHLMKYVLLFLATFMGMSALKAQTTKAYDAQWKKVDDLLFKKNLPKSALAEVRLILSKAKKEGHDAQVLKALVYMIGLQEETREDNQLKGIRETEAQMAGMKEPSLSILKSLLAGQYKSYYDEIRYELYERTTTVQFKKEDIATWTAEDFHKRIAGLYHESLAAKKLLQGTKVDAYEPVLLKGTLRALRPTLYDLLANEALEYFLQSDVDINTPAFTFEIIENEAFAPAERFARHRFITNDTLSFEHGALQLYQELVRFHLDDAKPDALIDADLSRLEFVHRNFVGEDKDSLYEAALQAIITRYGINTATHRAVYLLAGHLDRQANTYDPHGDTTHRYTRLKAIDLVRKVISDSSNKKGFWAYNYNLYQRMTKPRFHFEMEKVNIPAEPFRVLIHYKALPVLYFRVVAVDAALKEKLTSGNHYEEAFWTHLEKAKPVASWQQSLPATQDFQEHRVEAKVDALPAGEYILFALESKTGTIKKTLMGAQYFSVSSISFISRNKDHFVLHRKTGQPLSGAKVQLWEQRYDRKTSANIKVKGPLFTADANGYFVLKTESTDRYRQAIFLEFQHGAERFSPDLPIYDYFSSEDKKPDNKSAAQYRDEHTYTYLFTDRALYRPGQVVFFKGITIATREDGKKEIRPAYTAEIYLYDANNQVKDSITVTTNEYGSFTGSFQLPLNGLTGNFYVAIGGNKGAASFSVEEYKRPKFSVAFEPVTQAYRLMDTVQLTGTAKAYAGNTISGAKVSYRVQRQPRLLYDWYSFRSSFPQGYEAMEIAHGESVTDADGKFTVHFTAIPDKKVNKEFDPLFDYFITADVTDINGETHSANETVTVGYKSLILEVTVPERLPLDSGLKSVSIRAKNMAGEIQKAMVTVTLSRLIPEDRPIRERYWKRPDQFVMSKQEYRSYFPHDEYDGEHDYRNWQRQPVLEQTDTIKADGSFFTNNGNLAPGQYEVVVTARDKDGQPVKAIHFVELFDDRQNKPAVPSFLWVNAPERNVEPGESVSLRAGSSLPVFLISAKEDLTQKGKTFSFSRINNEIRSFEYRIREEDRGGFGMVFFFVRENRFFQQQENVAVPWSNKDLKIEFATFRDKTLPGSREQWKVKISGLKSEKVAAEMLAGMYDASLDQYLPHSWSAPSIWPVFSNSLLFGSGYNFIAVQSMEHYIPQKGLLTGPLRHDRLINFDNLPYYNDEDGRFKQEEAYYPQAAYDMEVLQEAAVGTAVSAPRMMRIPEAQNGMANMDFSATKATYANADMATDSTAVVSDYKFTTGGKKPAPDGPVSLRKNFNETAFFFPQLATDAEGNIEFTFTLPEALTRWKLMTLAHTKDLAFGFNEKDVIAQKELMVQPNAPRFLRQGDRMEFSVKVVNLSQKELTGQAELQLVDAATNQSVDGWFLNTFPNQYFTVAAGGSEVVKFPMEIPFQFTSTLQWRAIARSGTFSDGEEMILPVLTNRLLVTESMPLQVKGSGTKNYTFKKLTETSSETLQHHALTIEYTSNPSWYVVQALPYLMEFPYECSEQTWNRYYANAIARNIVSNAPRIRQIFERWQKSDTAALMSNLLKNSELKTALLEETPWVLEAKTEEQQKKNIALLYDLVRLQDEGSRNLQKLAEMQHDNGSFPWFKGGREDRFITQYILTGIGRLRKLKATDPEQYNMEDMVVSQGLSYTDRAAILSYTRLKKSKADLTKMHIGAIEVQYLYMHSFYSANKDPKVLEVTRYYKSQSQKFWTKMDKLSQAMIALALHRSGDKATPLAILKSLKETSITAEELGMYWKESRAGYSWNWYEAPIETQALMIEAFNEITNDRNTVDELRTWLVRNKQTNNWRTTKATADACYALLLNGTQWIAAEPVVQVKLGNITTSNTTNNAEAGTGYFKTRVEPTFIRPEMGNISVTIQQPSGSSGLPVKQTSWGSVYWQYFEDLDKITAASTPLQLNKALFIEKNTDRGPQLTPVGDGVNLKVGDKVKVRIELRVNRDMEYVHMKDLRASALEPTNVLSSYKWQGGLGYYESTRDASTNFFFDFLPKGTYVFEYTLFATHAGAFSNGVTSIQCMYAPEFAAHSEGIRITIE